MYQWTEKMKNVGQVPSLEEPTRQAIIKGIEFLTAIPEGAEQPTFTGNHVLVPTNDTAKKMAETVTAHVDEKVVGWRRSTLAATAINAALLACGSGRKGDDAWNNLVERLSK